MTRKTRAEIEAIEIKEPVNIFLKEITLLLMDIKEGMKEQQKSTFERMFGKSHGGY